MANLKSSSKSKSLYKHPDYLLDDPLYKEHIDTAIREFLLIHSDHVEEYYQVLIHEPMGPHLSTHIMLQGTSPLTRQYMDHSSTLIKCKIDYFLLKINGIEVLPEPKEIDHIFNEIIQKETNPTNLFFALMAHIEAAACGY
jgi:hypothetical protein